MDLTKAHLKLTILDIYNCPVTDDGLSFFCTLFSENSKNPKIFKNVRINGLVTDKKERSFIVDDGTGVIVVTIPKESFIELPKISDYVEVFGELYIKSKTERRISALCCCQRNEPMEEIRHLLEQAAIHRDYHRYRQLTQQTFLSSETNTTSIYSAYTDKISALFMKCDREKGLTISEIQKECDDDLIIAKQVIDSLIDRDEIYEDGNSFYPI